MTLSFSELGSFLQRKREELLKVLDEFNEEEYELRETVQGWTVTEVVEHIGKVEGLVLNQVKHMLEHAPWTPAENEAEKLVDIHELFREKGLLGTRKSSPEAALPTGLIAYPEVLIQLTELRQRLEQQLPVLADRGTNGIVAVHPLGVELNVCQWVLFSAYHEWAHIHQLKRIRAANPRRR
jgi:hypothetical protein